MEPLLKRLKNSPRGRGGTPSCQHAHLRVAVASPGEDEVDEIWQECEKQALDFSGLDSLQVTKMQR